MRFVAVGTALLLPAIAGTAHASEFCGKRQRNASVAVTITLDPALHAMRKQFSFYVTGPEEGFILFFRPDVVLTVTETLAGEYLELASALSVMRHDLPLDRDTDLYKYALRSRPFELAFDRLLARLLDTGKVFVDTGLIYDVDRIPPDANDRFDPRIIKKVPYKTRWSEGRAYCTGEGMTLLDITDVYID